MFIIGIKYTQLKSKKGKNEAKKYIINEDTAIKIKANLNVQKA